jgi:hypothetical protein
MASAPFSAEGGDRVFRTYSNYARGTDLVDGHL